MNKIGSKKCQISCLKDKVERHFKSNTQEEEIRVQILTLLELVVFTVQQHWLSPPALQFPMGTIIVLHIDSKDNIFHYISVDIF